MTTSNAAPMVLFVPKAKTLRRDAVGFLLLFRLVLTT